MAGQSILVEFTAFKFGSIVSTSGSLAHLSVVRNVDSHLDLPADDVVDGLLQRALVGVVIDVLAAFLGRQKGQQLRRSDQAPRMGRKDSVHVLSSPRMGPLSLVKASRC